MLLHVQAQRLNLRVWHLECIVDKTFIDGFGLSAWATDLALL